MASPVRSSAMALVAFGGALVWTGRFAEAERWLDRADALPCRGGARYRRRAAAHAGDAPRRAGPARAGAGGIPGGGEDACTRRRAFLRPSCGASCCRRGCGWARPMPSAQATAPSTRRAARASCAPPGGHPPRRGQPRSRRWTCWRPLIEDSASSGRDVIQALLLAAAAHDQLGDRRAAEAAVERALELAEPDGIILPFMLAPVRRAAGAPPQAPHRPRHTAVGDPRRARRIVAAHGAASRRRRWKSSATPSCASSGTCRAT